MSSNGFSTATKLISQPVVCRHRCLLLQRIVLGQLASREWFIEVNGRRQAMLLLRHRSFWGSQLAGLTLRTAAGDTFSAWFIARGQQPSAWRRLRVGFHFP
jgi:hypothetical protein